MSAYNLNVRVLEPRGLLPTCHEVRYNSDPAAYLAEVLEYLEENAPVGYKSAHECWLAFYAEAVSELSVMPPFGGSGAEACLRHHLQWLPDVRPTRLQDATLYDLRRSTLATLGFVRHFTESDTRTYIVDWSEFAADAIVKFQQRIPKPVQGGL